MFFQIAKTREEKRQCLLFWEQQRKEAEIIRETYDKVNEDNYHEKFYKKFMILSERPNFLEPITIVDVKIQNRFHRTSPPKT